MVAQPRVHSDEWDILIQPFWPRLRLADEEASWFVVLSPNLGTGRPHSWGWPALAPLPGSAHFQLPPPPWDAHLPGGCFPMRCSMGSVTTTGSITKWLERRVASQDPTALLEAASHHSCATQIPWQKHWRSHFLRWFETRVRGAKRWFLSGWKTGKWEHKRKLSLWLNFQSSLSFSSGTGYENPMWCTECSALDRGSCSRDLTTSKEARINWWFLLLLLISIHSVCPHLHPHCLVKTIERIIHTISVNLTSSSLAKPCSWLCEPWP